MKSKNLVRAIERYRRDHEADADLCGELARWTASSGDSELARINPFALAGELNLDRARLLETFVTLTHEGIFDLNWDFHCTECNAVAGTHNHLDRAAAENHCPLCDVDFRNDLTKNVEVTFTPATRYYTLSRRYLDERTARTVALHKAKEIRLPEHYVRGIDCLHIRAFRELFESETLSPRESLRIGWVCIMFTDIKGSTSLYDRLGDTTAYGLVRAHFEILFRAVETHGGVVVKTIGDSVMASFTQAKDAARASLAIQRAFRELNARKALRDEILVKVGIHAGGTIMVNLNNRLDYFGQTVNMAARIQSSADGGEVVISEAIRNDRESIDALKRGVRSLTRRMVELKGIRGARPIFRLNFAAQAQGEAGRPRSLSRVAAARRRDGAVNTPAAATA